MGAFCGQPNNYSCGVLAIFNAINALGGESDYATIKRLSGCTSRNGTTIEGVLSALDSLGYKGTPYKTKNHDNAWKFVRKWAATNPMICLVDNREHYFVASGIIGDRVIVIDSGAYLEGEEMGVFPMNKDEFLQRWVCRNSCFAIRVSN